MRGARRGDHRELLATVTADEAEPEIALAEAIAGGTAPRIVSSQGRARPSSATDFGRVSNRAYKRQGQTMTTASEIFDDANLAEDFPQDLLLLRQEMKQRTGAGGRPAGPVEAGGGMVVQRSGPSGLPRPLCRARERRPVLGDPWWRRQLRRRDLLRVPPPPRRAGGLRLLRLLSRGPRDGGAPVLRALPRRV
jgi:hypothetical protein